MSLFELCIRRPVLSTVLSLLVLVIGLISYSRLAVREYPKIDARHLYVDNLALQLVREPSQFEVIVTSNMFGDIVTDIGAGLLQGFAVSGADSRTAVNDSVGGKSQVTGLVAAGLRSHRTAMDALGTESPEEELARVQTDRTALGEGGAEPAG